MPYRLLEGERAAIGSAVVHLIWKGKEPQPGQTSVVSQQDLLWYLECNCGTGGMAIAGSQVEGDLASLSAGKYSLVATFQRAVWAEQGC